MMFIKKKNTVLFTSLAILLSTLFLSLTFIIIDFYYYHWPLLLISIIIDPYYWPILSLISIIIDLYYHWSLLLTSIIIDLYYWPLLSLIFIIIDLYYYFYHILYCNLYESRLKYQHHHLTHIFYHQSIIKIFYQFHKFLFYVF